MKVVVLDVCTLHLGYVGCYGNEWIATPHLDRLAAEGIVFDQHYADCPGAAAEERTCWTGRYHFPREEGSEDPTGDQLPSLARLLEDQGIEFVRVSAAQVQRTVLSALDALNDLAGREQWLLWVDLPALAPPWQVPEEYLGHYFNAAEDEDEDEDEELLEPWPDPSRGPLDREDALALERLQNTYAGAVTYLDEQLGVLLEELGQRGLAEQVLLCVTADRGLALGEHGIVGECRPWLHDEVIHLPLLMRLPGGAEVGRRVFALTQPVDLLPTFLEAFGLPGASWAHGSSLWPLLRGQAEQVRTYVCAGLRLGDSAERTLRTLEWGFILPGGPAAPAGRRPQLYVKPDDRWEVNDVVQHHLDLADHLEQTLRGFVEATRRSGPLQAPELRAIEAEGDQTNHSDNLPR